MDTNKTFTIEELKTQYEALGKLIQEQERAEKAAREAKLKAEKEARKAEVDEAVTKCKDLIKAYMHDYGIYSFKSAEDEDIFSSKFWNWIW